MNGTTYCPTCQAVIAVGVSPCPTCRTVLAWGPPGAVPPPNYAPPPPAYGGQAPAYGALPAPARHHRRGGGGRRGGGSAGPWIAAMLVVALLTGGFLVWRGQKEKRGSSGDTGPAMVPSGAGGSRAGDLTPFLVRFDESYPDFYRDLSYAPEPAPVLPGARSYRHQRAIGSEYTAFRQCTFDVLYPFPVDVKSTSPGAGASPHTLGAFVGFRGTASKGVPYVVTLVFDVEAPATAYPEVVSLTFSADGRPLPSVKCSWNQALESRGTVKQTLLFPVPTATLVKALDAKELRAKIRTNEFDLHEDDVEALRDFASRLGPHGP